MSKYRSDRTFLNLLLTAAISGVLALGGMIGVSLPAAGLVPMAVHAAEEGTGGDSEGSNSTENAGGNSEGDSSAENARDVTEEDSHPWSEDYYRASDTSGELTNAQQEDLDSICIRFMEDYHADLALLAVSSEDLDGRTLAELAALYYEDCGFGYGEDKDGFQMVYNLDTDEAAVVPFGVAAEMVPDSYLRRIEGYVAGFREKYGVFGPFYATTRMLNNYMAENYAADGSEAAEGSSVTETSEVPDGTGAVDVAETSEVPDGTGAVEGSGEEMVTDPSARVGEGADMPAWYPVYPDVFPKYHDENAPRVVDVADLFAEDQEKQLESRLAEIRKELQKDIVIFTDVSTYGLGRDIYSADFYDFNGYGIGDQYEGVVLFICMDPKDRGWWACCTGPETRGLYTEAVADQIDDMLYEYMVDGYYYEGVADWIENFRRLYRNGSPYLDDWAVVDPASVGRVHNADSPRVVDEIGLLTDSEVSSLSELAQQISQKHGVDVIIHTALDPGILTDQEYSERYYYFGGYGLGDKFDGVQLTIFKRPVYQAYPAVSAFGDCAAKLTKVNQKRLENRCEYELAGDHYYEAAKGWLEQTDHMLRTGRAPQSSLHWTVMGIISVLIGSIYAGISLFRAYLNMDTPAIAENANAYYVQGSLKMRKVSDTFVDMRTSKHYSPVEKRSSGGGASSGGGSSYSGSYKGSSGTSHSGSGRNF